MSEKPQCLKTSPKYLEIFQNKWSELAEDLSNGSVEWCWVAGDRQGRTLKDGLGF